MKKIVVLLTAVAMLFCGLWVYEMFDKSDTKKLCQHYAIHAHAAFEQHEMLKEQNKDSSAPLANYWLGVSRFYAFSETLQSLVGYEDSFYKDCHSLHNHMLLIPEEVLSHMNELLAAMDILSENYADREGQKIISDLNYLFQYGVCPQ